LQSAATSVGTVTISIGLATFPTHGDSLQDLLSAADKALYAAKDAGRNRVVVAPEPPHSAGGVPLESSDVARIDRPE
jgi:predicted signal transduction protein with EAL and GGDEF domain